MTSLQRLLSVIVKVKELLLVGGKRGKNHYVSPLPLFPSSCVSGAFSTHLQGLSLLRFRQCFGRGPMVKGLLSSMVQFVGERLDKEVSSVNGMLYSLNLARSPIALETNPWACPWGCIQVRLIKGGGTTLNMGSSSIPWGPRLNKKERVLWAPALSKFAAWPWVLPDSCLSPATPPCLLHLSGLSPQTESHWPFLP